MRSEIAEPSFMGGRFRKLQTHRTPTRSDATRAAGRARLAGGGQGRHRCGLGERHLCVRAPSFRPPRPARKSRPADRGRASTLMRSRAGSRRPPDVLAHLWRAGPLLVTSGLPYHPHNRAAAVQRKCSAAGRGRRWWRAVLGLRLRPQRALLRRQPPGPPPAILSHDEQHIGELVCRCVLW
jgi:hypothetical protein